MADARDHEALRAAVNDQIKRNVKAGMGPVAPTGLGAATLAPWDIVVKFKAGRRIADEEKARHSGHHTDQGDADHHAELSRGMANETGPVFSTLVGWGHELPRGIVQSAPRQKEASDEHEAREQKEFVLNGQVPSPA